MPGYVVSYYNPIDQELMASNVIPYLILSILIS